MERNLVGLSTLEMVSMMGVGIKREPTMENLMVLMRDQLLDQRKEEVLVLNLVQWKQKEQLRVPCWDDETAVVLVDHWEKDLARGLVHHSDS